MLQGHPIYLILFFNPMICSKFTAVQGGESQIGRFCLVVVFHQVGLLPMELHCLGFYLKTSMSPTGHTYSPTGRIHGVVGPISIFNRPGVAGVVLQTPLSLII